MIGEEVRRRREELGLTGAQLAERAGLAPSAVSQIETGKRIPSSASVLKLAEGLGVEVGELYPKKAQAPLPLDAPADKVGGAIDPAAAAATIKALRSAAEGLAAVWNRDVDLYEQHGWDLRPHRTMEMGAAVVVLYQQFWGALETLQRHAQELGFGSDASTWDPQSKQLLLESGSSIRALAELYNMIDRAAEKPGIDSDDFRAMREEFDPGIPAFLVEDPRWPAEIGRARATVGVV